MPAGPETTGLTAFSPDRVAGAAAWRVVYLVIQGGSSLGLFVVLAHALPASAFAATALAQGILVVAQALGDFGLSQAVVSALPAWVAREPPTARPRLVAGAALAFCCAAACALALALLATLMVPPAARPAVASISPAAAVTVIVAGADGLLRASGEFARPVAIVACSRLAPFVAVPVAAISGTATATCTAIAIATVCGSVPAIAFIARRARTARAADACAVGRAALPLGISQLFLVGGSRVNTLLVGGLASVRAAAVFEASWRLYQLGQYAIGSVATAIAPFAGDALGGDRRAEFLTLLRRTMSIMVIGGLLCSLAVALAGGVVSDVLFGSFGPAAERAVMPLAVVFPFTLAGLAATYVLGASDCDRRHLIWAYGCGGLVNIALVAALVPSNGARGATMACACGLVVTHAWILQRYFGIVRRVRAVPVPAEQPA